MNAGLQLDALRVSRGGRVVVTDLTATLPAGRISALIGPNGAGKSSLLGALAGILPARGRIDFGGGPPPRAAVAYMPQAAILRATLSVFEVVLLGRLERLGWRVRPDDAAAAARALVALGLEELAERRVGTLSGGQQQLVLLAQQLARRPRLLILDEPTSALDLRRQLVVLDHLSAYAGETGAVVVLALHDLSLAARYAAHLLLLRDGHLVEAGPPSQVLQSAPIRSAYDVEAEIVICAAGFPVVVPIHPNAAG